MRAGVGHKRQMGRDRERNQRVGAGDTCESTRARARGRVCGGGGGGGEMQPLPVLGIFWRPLPIIFWDFHCPQNLHFQETDFVDWPWRSIASLGTQSWALPFSPFLAKPRPSTIVMTTSASSIELRDSVMSVRGVLSLRPEVCETTPGVSKYRVWTARGGGHHNVDRRGRWRWGGVRG